jgi:hypothetical protein
MILLNKIILGVCVSSAVALLSGIAIIWLVTNHAGLMVRVNLTVILALVAFEALYCVRVILRRPSHPEQLTVPGFSDRIVLITMGAMLLTCAFGVGAGIIIGRVMSAGR